MDDDFDRFLSDALAPQEREPDRSFVSRVQARIAVEECFALQRRSLIRDLATQLLALLAVGAGTWWLGRSTPVAAWASESPATALAILLAMFMFVAAVITLRTGPGERETLPW